MLIMEYHTDNHIMYIMHMQYKYTVTVYMHIRTYGKGFERENL